MGKPPLKTNSQSDLQTPPHALEPLISYLDKACGYIRSNYIIWECAQGEGLLTKELKRLGFNVIGSDIKTGEDFLIWQPEIEKGIDPMSQDPNFDCIITNPPYDSKNEFLKRAYELDRPFAFLMPLTTLETPSRQYLFKKYGIEIILLNRRINFIPLGQNFNSVAWFAVAWFTHGLNIGQQLSFGEVPDIKTSKIHIDKNRKALSEVL